MSSSSDLLSDAVSACVAKMKITLVTDIDRSLEELHTEMVDKLGEAVNQIWNARLPAADSVTYRDPQRNLPDMERAKGHLKTGNSSAPQERLDQYLVAECSDEEPGCSSTECPATFDACDSDYFHQGCRSVALIQEASKSEMLREISPLAMPSCATHESIQQETPQQLPGNSTTSIEAQKDYREHDFSIEQNALVWSSSGSGQMLASNRTSALWLVHEASYMLYEKKHPRIGGLVKTRFFEIFFVLVIILNCAIMGFEAEAAVSNSHSARSDYIFAAFEHIFTTLFTIELLMRLVAHGVHKFTPCWTKSAESWWNFVDASLVVMTGILFTWLIPLFRWIIGLSNTGTSVGRASSMLLACRLVRLVGVVQKVPQFHEVWLLLRGLRDSMRTLFWTVVVISFMTYIFAVFGLVLITKDLKDERDSTPDAALRQELTELLEFVGGLDSLMYTLLQLLTLDSWNAIVRRLMKQVSWCWVYFYAYIAVAVFVLMNLVTATIVENAVTNSRQDEDQLIKAREAAKLEELKGIEHLFKLMDADGSGTLSWTEFKAAFDDTEMSKKWKLLDFDPNQCKEVFELLDDGDGEIEISEFFTGLAQMKGTAQSKDIFRLRKEVARVKDMLQERIQRDARLNCTIPHIEASVSKVIVKHGMSGTTSTNSEENNPVFTNTSKDTVYDDTPPIRMAGKAPWEAQELMGASVESHPKHKVLLEKVEDVLQCVPEGKKIGVQTILTENMVPALCLKAKPSKGPGKTEVEREAVASVPLAPVDPEMPSQLPLSSSPTTFSEEQLPRPLPSSAEPWSLCSSPRFGVLLRI